MASDIRSMLTAQQVAEHYGFEVNRSGFMKCPFHTGDRTASLKLYDGESGFHCFGCGAHGSIIDFVMRLFDLNFRQAVLRINATFTWALPPVSRTVQPVQRPWRPGGRKGAKRIRLTRTFATWPMNCTTGRMFWRFSHQSVKAMMLTIIHYMSRPSSASPYIEYWLDDFIEKGGKEHWMKCPLIPAMTI